MNLFFHLMWNVKDSIFPWTSRNFGNYPWRLTSPNIFMWIHFAKGHRGPSKKGIAPVYYPNKLYNIINGFECSFFPYLIVLDLFCLVQNGSMASSKDNQTVHAAAQHSSARGGGIHRIESEPPITASQQGYTNEN